MHLKESQTTFLHVQLWFLNSTMVFPALTRIIYFADVLIKDVISQAMKDVNQNTLPKFYEY